MLRSINLEFRIDSCGNYEIVEWLDTICFSIVMFEQDSEGFNARFVGSRFIGHDMNLMNLLTFGQQYLNSLYEFNSKHKGM